MSLMKKIWYSLTASLVGIGACQAQASFVDDKVFRDIFRVEMPDELKPIAERLIYAPIPSPQLPAGKSADELLKILDEQFADTKPISLYKSGIEIAKTESPAVTAEQISQALGNHPITVVIVPGIFGEFIPTRAFEDIFTKEKSSASYQKFQNDLVAKGECRTGDEVQCDKTTLMKSMTLAPENSGEQVEGLGNLISVTDIEKTNVRLVLFNTPMLSLESLGDIKDRAAIFNRRLKKFFQLEGIPKNIVLVGYSRGTPVGLEMLSQAMQERNPGSPWLAHTRGLIALGGVTYGSSLADVAVNAAHDAKPNKTAVEVAAAQQLVDSLQLVDDATLKRDYPVLDDFALESVRVMRVTENMAAWYKFLTTFSQAEQISGPAALFAKIKDTVAQSRGTDVTSTIALALKFAGQYGLLPDMQYQSLSDALEHAPQIAQELLKAGQGFISQYSLNIKRFKALVTAARVGAVGLATAERKTWWQTHQIPTQGIRYYSIAASFGVPTDAADVAGQELAQSQIIYNMVSQDYLMLRQNYLDYAHVSSHYVNDSQVAAQRVKFWPELTQALNPNITGLQTTFLGTLGAHHWSLAFREVNHNKDGKMDPFPREALMKSLAAAVALDLEQTK